MAVYRAPQGEETEKKRTPVGCIIFLVVLIAIVAAGAMAFFAVDGEIQGKKENPDASVTITVAQGSGLGTIADQLKEAGVIRFPQVFRLYVKGQSNVAQKLQYGDFSFNKGMSYAKIVDVLVNQRVERASVRVTFPEGTTAQGIAKLMEEAGLCTADEFLQTADEEDFSQFEFWGRVEDNDLRFFKCEGYLFPDTYDFFEEDTVYNYVATFYQRFEDEMSDELYARMDELGFSLNDTVTLASFVQEEAGNEEDERVSAVFHNRLAESSPYPRLESNASSYVQNDQDNNYLYNWIAPLFGGFDQIPAEQYKAYNTYDCTGLPAGPISNPGGEAIRAALYPDEEYLNEKYYFFVTDLAGTYYYGKTPDDHVANIQKAAAVNAKIG